MNKKFQLRVFLKRKKNGKTVYEFWLFIYTTTAFCPQSFIVNTKNSNFIHLRKFIINTDSASITSNIFSYQQVPNWETLGLNKFQSFLFIIISTLWWRSCAFNS